MNVDIRNIENKIFDDFYDWYALADEGGNRFATRVLRGWDALYYLEDLNVYLLGTSNYSKIELCIPPGTKGEYKKIWDNITERLQYISDEFVDKGWIAPGTIYFEVDPFDGSRAAIYYEN